jgi:uncharacterized protein (DUF952 family)
MTVLFHITSQRDWERAMRAGIYTAASLDGDGFIHCSTATQHAAVANTAYRGRTGLVLLLVDSERLTAEVRFEQAAPGGEAFPHVYGPLDLDAVFEATPYRPAADGRFHPYEEASGFAAHGAATLDAARRRAVEVMAADQSSLFAQLPGWDLRLAAPGAALPRWDGGAIAPPFHQVWARKGPGTPAGADDPTMLGFLLEQGGGDRWVFRRHPALTRPLGQVGMAGALSLRSAQQRRRTIGQPVAAVDHGGAGGDRPGRGRTPGRVGAEQQEEVVVQAAEVDAELVEQRFADDPAGIPQVGHPRIDQPAAVDLRTGVAGPAGDPDHVDPQPGVRVPLEDVLGHPTGARKARPSGRRQGQQEPRRALVGIEPGLQAVGVVEVGHGQTGRPVRPGRQRHRHRRRTGRPRRGR